MKIRQETTVSEFFESPDDFEDLIEVAERNASAQHEIVFVADIKNRFYAQGARTPLSDLQLSILHNLTGA